MAAYVWQLDCCDGLSVWTGCCAASCVKVWKVSDLPIAVREERKQIAELGGAEGEKKRSVERTALTHSAVEDLCEHFVTARDGDWVVVDELDGST